MENPALTIFSWNQNTSWDFIRSEYRPGDALPDVVHNPTTNNSMLYSPLFYSGSTVLLGGDLCLNFIFRMTLSALTSQKLMKNWGVQTSGSIPVIMIIPETEEVRIRYEISRTPCLASDITVLMPMQIHPEMALHNFFSTPGIVFIDDRCLPKNDDLFNIRKKLGLRNAVIIFRDGNFSEKNLPKIIDGTIHLKRLGFGNERDFIEAQIISSCCKNKKFYFSMNNSIKASWLCRYDDRPPTMQRSLRIPPVIQNEIIVARRDRRNLVPIRVLAERYGLSIATLNRFLKQSGLTKLASPDGKKRGRKHALMPNECVNLSDIRKTADLSHIHPQYQTFPEEIIKVSQKRFSEPLTAEDRKLAEIMSIAKDYTLSASKKLEEIKKLL